MSDFVNIYLDRYKARNEMTNHLSGPAVVNNSIQGQGETSSSAGTSLTSEKKGLWGKTIGWMFSSSRTPAKQHPPVDVMYANIYNSLAPEDRINLLNLYKNGKLFSRDSNDGSSTLENLYKIQTTPRLEIFDKKNIIKETIKTLNNPYLITQNIGEIPYQKIPEVLKAENLRLMQKIEKARQSEHFNPDDIASEYPIKPEDLFNIHGSTCPAASIEFNLADRRPAEFVRYIEGFTGPEKSIKTRINFSDLSADYTESIVALTQQKSDFKSINWNTAEVTVKPDENAYIRADAQEDHRKKDTRSMVDVLMQSALMQLGSRKTYNSLTDKRSKEVGGGEGLNQFEIAFVESIVDSKNQKIPLIYMELDYDLTKVLNYAYDFEEVKQQFVKTLDHGQNIITGFLIDVDNKGNVITPQGHEILLTGYKYDDDGKLWFKYNDTDDGNYFAPSWLEADSFIPKVHHANISRSALKQDFKPIPIGYLYLNEYKTIQQQKQAQKQT